MRRKRDTSTGTTSSGSIGNGTVKISNAMMQKTPIANLTSNASVGTALAPKKMTETTVEFALIEFKF